MKLIIIPKKSFRRAERKDIKKIIRVAENFLKKNNISIPRKIYFYNSFSEFVKKVLPEVENYGFDKETSKEIILCALNNGTYGTINYQENSIVEMNFNPFREGEYSIEDFLELIIHESLHLHLSKSLKLDINALKFKFKGEKYFGNPKIIQFDEGYAEFMTKKILNNFKIKKIKIPCMFRKKPEYKKKINNLNVDLFDKLFEKLLITNRNKGLKILSQEFNFNESNEKILFFVKKELRKIL